MSATLFYIHDPMCSWCWGFRPTWERLRAALPDDVTVRYLAGGLAPDTDEPMPAQMQLTIQGYWRRIEALLGSEFNFDFWTKNTPRRATWPACRAVLAAREQGREAAMIDAIQRAYYLEARNPSDRPVLLALAGEIGLDTARFAAELDSSHNHETFGRERAQTQALGARGFPSLVLVSDGRQTLLDLDYQNAEVMLAQVRALRAQAAATA